MTTSPAQTLRRSRLAWSLFIPLQLHMPCELRPIGLSARELSECLRDDLLLETPIPPNRHPAHTIYRGGSVRNRQVNLRAQSFGRQLDWPLGQENLRPTYGDILILGLDSQGQDCSVAPEMIELADAMRLVVALIGSQ